MTCAMSTPTTSADAAQLDLRAYLARIDFSPNPDLDVLSPSVHLLSALHEAHLLSVPFENLSIHYGQPIILDEAALYEKIVRRHRGGFCYELNGLFAWLLRQLGFGVTLLSAGVAQASGTYSPEFDHLALLVRHVEGADWLADVGFGELFRRPPRLQRDVKQDGADGHWYRLREVPADDSSHAEPPEPPEPAGSAGSAESNNPQPRAYWVLERREDAPAAPHLQWQPQYRFTLRPHALTDFVERCRYHQTSPDSHFTQQRICSRALPAGRISLSDLRLITTIQAAREEHLLRSEEEYRATLADQFGIVL
jgi:N-hydroxyarylamine O-acetyltransferase